MAKRHYPHLNLRIGSSYDDLKRQFGTFSYVMSLEVIAHVHDPRSFSRTICELLTDDGYAMNSTPYHGYFKNLAIAAVGGFDNHVKPLCDDGYVKFWSVHTLRTLLEEAGLRSIEFVRVVSCTRFRRHQVRCFMEQEVRHGEKAVYAGVQA